jgi:hypothetical protein
LPDATTTLVGRDTTDTLTNKTINLTSNTLVATSAQLASAITDETGSGSLVFATSPSLVTPLLGTPTSGNFSTGTFTWPTFNQNTTGTASNVTGIVAIANGGTGLTTTPANGALDIGNGTGFTRTTLTAGSGVTITNASGSITINATGTGGTVTSVSGTGVVNGLTLTGTVTTSGSLTLGGTLSLVSPPPIGSTTPSTGNFTTLTENSVAVVTQSDIGSAPNEIPLNQYLGSLAYQNGDAYYNTGMTVGFRNRLINGAMIISQRGVSPTQSGGGDYSVDRFLNYYSGNVYTSVQSTTAPSGFINSLLLTNTTASASPSYSFFGQKIEGLNCTDLGFGTSNASIVTLSFWVRSSVIGIYSFSLSNSDGNRSYAAQYTINTANTWELKTVSIGGDTTGTWLTTNGTGIFIRWNMGTGQSGRLISAGSWQTANADGATGSTGANTWANTVDATFYITGVQLEKGNIATSFDVRPYGTELALCQRYFWKSTGATPNDYPSVGSGGFITSTYFSAFIPYPVQMRATPTFSIGTGLFINTVSYPSVTSISQNYSNKYSGRVDFNTASSTAGFGANVGLNSDVASFIDASAEL